MRFMVMVKSTKDSEAGIPPSPQLMAGMGKLTEAMNRDGILLASDGLQPSSKGVRIRYVGGKRTVTDGPFIEVKELIGGYAIVRAGSKEEAVEWANRVVDIHIDAGVAELDMEIRPLFDPDCATRNS